MLIKILNNNLTERSNILADIVKALVGTWGITTSDDKKVQNIFSGRQIKTYIYTGTTLQNLRDNYKCMAIVVYTDGTNEIKVIEPKTTITTDKEINMAIMIAQIM